MEDTTNVEIGSAWTPQMAAVYVTLGSSAHTPPLTWWRGSGPAEIHGTATLNELLSSSLLANVIHACGCDWLLDLAREEQERPVPFTASEIHERWQERGGSVAT